MGTTEFSVRILQSLSDSSHEIAGIVTQPDRERGRGRQQQSSPVADFATDQGIPTIKPENKRDPILLEALRSWQPDVSVVAAFGLILTADVLYIPRFGSLNVHASLLPKYRGAAPVQGAIIAGEPVTGVTTMLMDEGMDTGAILLQKEVPIAPEQTAGELEEELAAAGASLLNHTLQLLENGSVEPSAQDDSQASYTKPLRPEDGYILWNETAARTHNRIRGCTPRPGARCFLRETPLRLWRSAPGKPVENAGSGAIIEVTNTGVAVACADNASVLLIEVQPPGKGRMSAAAHARGARLLPGEVFDTKAPSA